MLPKVFPSWTLITYDLKIPHLTLSAFSPTIYCRFCFIEQRNLSATPPTLGKDISENSNSVLKTFS